MSFIKLTIVQLLNLSKTQQNNIVLIIQLITNTLKDRDPKL